MSKKMDNTGTNILQRWRLILGNKTADGTDAPLNKQELAIDASLAQLYDSANSAQQSGLGASKPNISRWLDDIREYFPSTVVQVLQKDALERLGLQEMLLEPELLAHIEPDVHLVATLLSLNKVMPTKTRETARIVVQKVVEELQKRLHMPTHAALRGALKKNYRSRRPKNKDINWKRTIKANLKTWQPAYASIIPQKKRGSARRRGALRKQIILCVDQSGSMASSVVYASIFAAVMASLPSLRTHFIAFDTSVIDLSQELSNPIELLFGTQLGGGTDINKALSYCQQLITQPTESIVVLISDLYEGGNTEKLLRRAANISESGVQFISLLALNDEGKPIYNKDIAQQFVQLNIPTFGCTPQAFPAIMAAAINKQDMQVVRQKYALN